MTEAAAPRKITGALDSLAESWPVIVLGAGPAGSATALAVARRGIPVLLVERDRFPGEHNVCGGAMPAAVEEQLDVPPHVIDHHVDCNLVGTLEAPAELSFSRPNNLSTRRAVFDRWLAAQAVAAGARLVLETRGTAVDLAGRRLTLVSRRDGTRRNLTFEIIVFADGPHTLGHRCCGIGFAHEPGNAAVALEWDIEAPDDDRSALEFYFEFDRLPLGYTWLFPKRGHYNIGIGTMADLKGRELARELESFMDRHPLLRGRPVLRRRGGLIPLRPARHVARGRALAVGDAAGLVNPLTGAGLTYALWSGRVAGRLAATALHRPHLLPALAPLYSARLRLSLHFAALAGMTALAAPICRLAQTRPDHPIMRSLPHLVRFMVRAVWWFQRLAGRWL